MASTAIASQGTILQIATGTGGAKTVTGVAVGNPTIITCATHGFSNGDYITFDSNFAGTNAADLNGKSFTVFFKTTNTYAIGADTTGRTITAGTAAATPTTYTALKNFHAFGLEGGTANEQDISNFASTGKEFRLGLRDFGNLTASMHVDWADAGQQALQAAASAGSTKSFKLILVSGTTPTATFDALVKQFSIPNTTPDGVVDSTYTARITGDITWS